MKKEIFKSTGIAVPLGALRTERCPAIGEFCALKECAEFCAESGLKMIQLLPVNDSGTESSPYSSLTAFALHPIYISLQEIAGFDSVEAEYEAFLKKHKNSKRYDYHAILETKLSFLHRIYDVLWDVNRALVEQQCAEFEAAHPWTAEYAVFKMLKERFDGKGWTSWPNKFQKPSADLIRTLYIEEKNKKDALFFVWCQKVAFSQMKAAAEAVRSLGVTLKGDIPFLVNEDSDCVWAHRAWFDTSLVAGSPPDGDNPRGQKWGFPCYKWAVMKKDGYSWWKTRMAESALFFDACRLDHILGFFKIWATSETEATAAMGFGRPAKVIGAEELAKAGFSDERIRWLSLPHVNSRRVCDMAHENPDDVMRVMPVFMRRIGNEDLWLFKDKYEGSLQILADGIMGDPLRKKMAGIFAELWEDRTLIELAPGKFVPRSKHYETSAWNTLGDSEKNSLQKIFDKAAAAQERVWRKGAFQILSMLCSCTDMTLCGEDLGTKPGCVNDVLEQLEILKLKVIRWERDWQGAGMPYNSLCAYDPLSVATTSVHDSSTLRQWWNCEKDSVQAFIELCLQKEGESSRKDGVPSKDAEFSPEIAKFVLEQTAKAASAWLINPLQDFLYLDSAYYDENPDIERVNVPGTVSGFNWTFRIPATIESIRKNKNLISAIRKISEIHNENAKGAL